MNKLVYVRKTTAIENVFWSHHLNINLEFIRGKALSRLHLIEELNHLKKTQPARIYETVKQFLELVIQNLKDGEKWKK